MFALPHLMLYTESTIYMGRYVLFGQIYHNSNGEFDGETGVLFLAMNKDMIWHSANP